MTTEAKILSVNVGRPQLVMRNGEAVSTAIYKKPIVGRVVLRTLNLDGDRQADLSVHGGPTKAVYFSPSEHYAFWQAEFPAMDLQPGMFGENLTIDGLDEEAIAVGDRFSVGTTILEAVQPRLPCYKLGLRFGDPMMVKRFMRSGRFGTYFRVVSEGDVGAGDEVHLVHHDPASVPVSSLVNLRQES